MNFVTEKDKSLQIVCKFRQKRADKRLCDTSKQTFSYLKAKISRGVFNHSRGCSFCNIKSAALPPTDIYIPFTSKAAESVRLLMPPRQRRESFQLLPQARLAFLSHRPVRKVRNRCAACSLNSRDFSHCPRVRHCSILLSARDVRCANAP